MVETPRCLSKVSSDYVYYNYSYSTFISPRRVAQRRRVDRIRSGRRAKLIHFVPSSSSGPLSSYESTVRVKVQVQGIARVARAPRSTVQPSSDGPSRIGLRRRLFLFLFLVTLVARVDGHLEDVRLVRFSVLVRD
eukprot:30802-Pelagococcus_subviridis.AAC.5